MKIKKTVGFGKNGHRERKGYDIHTECGEVFRAMPLGSQRYQCNKMTFISLRAVKDSILKGRLSESEEADDVEPSEDSTLTGLDTWDCAYPCALIVKLVDFHKLNENSPQHFKTVIETLDNYGWLDCAGRPDIARAEREIARVEKYS